MKYMEPFHLLITYSNGSGILVGQDNNDMDTDQADDEDSDAEYALMVGKVKTYTKTEENPYWTRITKAEQPTLTLRDSIYSSTFNSDLLRPRTVVTTTSLDTQSGAITFHGPYGATRADIDRLCTRESEIVLSAAARTELERRDQQRCAEIDRLEAERNRPSFFRRINPFA